MNEISNTQIDENVTSTQPALEVVEEATLATLLNDIQLMETTFSAWPQEQQASANAHSNAIEALNSEAFKRLIKGITANPQMASMLKDVVGDEVIYAVLRRHGILKPNLFERVENALETIRPMLDSHGGDVQLISVEPPLAKVKFLGACDGCPASALTFYSGVKKAIQDHVPEITEVKQVKGLGGGGDDGVNFTSPFANYKSGTWAFAAKLNQFEEGETKVMEIHERSVLITRMGDKITCFENACAHMGLAMDTGEIGEGFITCPFHGFKYSLESGECLTAPEVQLQPHGVRVVGDRIELQFTD